MLIAIVCGFCCVLPLFFIAGVVGGAEIAILVAIILLAASVFILPTLVRRQKATGTIKSRRRLDVGADPKP
ncbi:MAG: hypothetical protein ACRDSK_02470 [Actinophytocola sp.]